MTQPIARHGHRARPSRRSIRARRIAIDDVSTLLDAHVTLRFESIDRLYVNGYVPRLRDARGPGPFLKGQPSEGVPAIACREMLSPRVRVNGSDTPQEVLAHVSR